MTRRYELTMYSEYHVVPFLIGGFPPRLIEAMHAYWGARPTLRRADGAYILCDDITARDDVARPLRTDTIRDGWQVVAILPSRVTFEVNGNASQSRQIHGFVRWLEKQVRCKLVDEHGQRIHPDDWLSVQLGRPNRGPRDVATS